MENVARMLVGVGRGRSQCAELVMVSYTNICPHVGRHFVVKLLLTCQFIFLFFLFETSLHPNGYSLASAGLDGVVRLWDIRKFDDSQRRSSKSSKTPKEIASLSCGYSISSSYFSPSGHALLTTSFADRIDLMDNFHLMTSTNTTTSKPAKNKFTKSIPHNNQTGRWLSTFMASWHDTEDVFVVGSLSKPRCIEVFNGKGKLMRAIQGEALSSVMSRCAFHASSQELIVIGGNSSGRVAVIK
jgi:WD repeat-containing protein 76